MKRNLVAVFLGLLAVSPIFATSKPNGVAWFDIMSHDAPRAQNFYGKVFGWKFQPVSPHYSLIISQKEPIGGMDDLHPGSGGGITIYFATEDIGETLARVNRSGGKTLLPVQPFGTDDKHQMALFRDLDGNTVGLVSEK